MCEHKATRPSVQTSSLGLASLNAIKRVIVILQYFTGFQPMKCPQQRLREA